MNHGNEAIQRQTDTAFLVRLTKEIDSLFEIVRLQLDDLAGSNFDKSNSYEAYDHMKSKMKYTMITKNVNKISDILSNRFGIRINIDSVKRGINDIASVTMPVINYKTVNMALADLDNLFPKKRTSAILWDTVATQREKDIYNTLDSLTQALRSDKFVYDAKRAYISGLDGSVFSISIDFLAATLVDITPMELAGIMMHEVGHIFTYLEYMNSTTNNTLVLFDTFNNERFTKQKQPIEALKVALQEVDDELVIDSSNPVMIMETLDMFILKTYKLSNRSGSIMIDFERGADQFATRLGLGDEIASAIVKIHSKGTIRHTEAEYKEESTALKVFRTIIQAVMFVISLLIFSVLGVFLLLILIGYKIIKFLLGMLLKFITSIVSLFFQGETDRDTTYDHLHKRLKKIKQDIIRQLRTMNVGDTGKQILVEQIDTVKEVMSSIDEKFSILSKAGDHIGNKSKFDAYENINEMIEDLEENELHYLSNKFDIFKK